MNASSDDVTRVLLVEDNPIDVRLLRLAFDKESSWRTAITVAADGEKAIQMLDESVLGDAPPDFVILDLNLPKRDGTEVLQWIRSTERLKDLPVAILSSSPMDVIHNKLSGASVEADCYFVKPMEVDVFFGLPRKLHFCYKKAGRNEPGPS